LVVVANRETSLLHLIADLAPVSRPTTIFTLLVYLRGIQRLVFTHIFVVLAEAELGFRKSHLQLVQLGLAIRNNLLPIQI